MASEKISILLMRDSGESQRYRIRRSFFRCLLLFFFLICPLIASFTGWLSFATWTRNKDLVLQIETLQAMNVHAFASAERLENVKTLLELDKEIAAELLASASRNDAEKQASGAIGLVQPKAPVPAKEQEAPAGSDDLEASRQEGPGHADFPEVNTGEIVVESVNSRLITTNRLRTAFDIRNPSVEILSGMVSCILTLANGETINLSFMPRTAGFYRIQRWKRAVLVSEIDEQLDMMNSQVIIEIHNDEKKLIYRNIFPIEQK